MRQRGFETVTKYDKQKIILPTRGSKYSAGYDFYLMDDIHIKVGEKIKVYTAIKAYMLEDELLEIHVRSSLGIKGLVLLNTVGIIDSDYYNNLKNEGEIILFIKNEGENDIILKQGERIVQGIFKKYLKIDEEEELDLRKGGFGSTNK